MNKQKIILVGMTILSIMYNYSIHAEKASTSQDSSGDISCDICRASSRDSYPEGYSDGYSAEYSTPSGLQGKCDYYDDILDDLFLPVDGGYAYVQPDVAPPSRITVFFASLGIELLLTYCKVKAWLAQHCCSRGSQDVSQDIYVN